MQVVGMRACLTLWSAGLSMAEAIMTKRGTTVDDAGQQRGEDAEELSI